MTNDTPSALRPFAPVLTIPGRWHDVTLESTSSRDALDMTPGAIRSFRIMGDMMTDTYGAARSLAMVVADCQSCMLRARYGKGLCDSHSLDVWAGTPRH